jgi:hypothetical protein
LRPGTFAPVAAALAAAVLAGAPDAHAFRMIQNEATGRVTAGAAVACNDPDGFARWRDASTSWRHNLALQGAGKAAALQSAMASWTGVAGAAHRLNYSGTTGAGFTTDGQNTLVWANGNGCVGTCLALTALVLQSGQVIVESDVTFNNASNWETDGSDFDTEAVAAHELGHALGIHHTEVATAPTPTMNAFHFGPDGRTLSPDDVAALRCSQSRFPPRPVLRLVAPAVPIEAVPGRSVTVPLTFVRGPGFTAPLDLSVTMAPPGVTASFSSDPATGTTASLTLTLAPSIAFGSLPVVVRAAGGGETATDNFALAVKRLVVRIDDGSVFVVAGEPAVVSGVTLLRAPGFAEPVTLSVQGLPSAPPGHQVTATPVPVTIAGTSSTGTLRASAGRFVQGGDFPATLTATAASASDTQTFAIEVFPAF